MTIDAYEAMNAAFQSGDIQQCDNDTLQKHLLLLCSHNERNETIRHRDIIRGITINQILLQRHIDGLNKRNEKLTWWVIALAIAALISATVQTVVTVMAYTKTPTVETTSQTSASPQQKKATQAPISTSAQSPASLPAAPEAKPP